MDWAIISLGSVPDLFALILNQPHAAELFAVTAWYLWTWHNKSWLNEAVIPLNRLAITTKCHLLEFKKFHKPPVWKPPTAETFKTYFDGAISENEEEASIGVVIWNSHGEVMASLSEKIPILSSVIAGRCYRLEEQSYFPKKLGLITRLFRVIPKLLSILFSRGELLFISSAKLIWCILV